MCVVLWNVYGMKVVLSNYPKKERKLLLNCINLDVFWSFGLGIHLILNTLDELGWRWFFPLLVFLKKQTLCISLHSLKLIDPINKERCFACFLI